MNKIVVGSWGVAGPGGQQAGRYAPAARGLCYAARSDADRAALQTLEQPGVAWRGKVLE